MSLRPTPDAALLNAAGLNLLAVFDIAGLPDAIRATLPEGKRQLILIGHGGPRLWAAVQAAGINGTKSEHPIDDFTVVTVRRWAAVHFGGAKFEILYPGDAPVGLQVLGRLAGWHHDTPFMVGINATWGPWFAYRAALVTDTDFAPTAPMTGTSPCQSCAAKPCITACPPGAAGERFDLKGCIDHRCSKGSTCAETCLARLACPVRPEHRYPVEQIRHSYGRSLADLVRYR